jgi:hypothetical protein
MSTIDPNVVMAQGEAYAKENLVDLVREIVSWKETGILEGTKDGSKVRTLGNILNVINLGRGLSLAKNMVKDFALEQFLKDHS